MCREPLARVRVGEAPRDPGLLSFDSTKLEPKINNSVSYFEWALFSTASKVSELLDHYVGAMTVAV